MIEDLYNELLEAIRARDLALGLDIAPRLLNSLLQNKQTYGWGKLPLFMNHELDQWILATDKYFGGMRPAR